ncbi:hypothetical protein [Corynebacterium hindlerae]|uniref:hypothetical protein n=1 Tax=Corynebacterium hindlerae TaxID=699041 RepID=UPI0031B6AF60
MKKLMASVAESLSIPFQGCKLLVRHWPALVVVLCTAFAVRAAVLWVAVAVSDSSPLIATLLVPLAPLAVMTGIIIALWVMQPSLPFLSTAVKAPRAGYLSTTRLLTIGGLLIPFLTVYASNGLLKDDLRTFVYDATLDESINTFTTTDFSRVFINDTTAALILILVVLFLRKLIGFFALGERHFGIASFSAYLEALWMVSLSAMLTANINGIKEWLTSRAVIAPAYHNFLVAKETLIENTGIVGKLYVGAGAILAKLDDTIVVPLAWLTLGAVLFGTTLLPKKKATPESHTGKHVKTPRSRWASFSKHRAVVATRSQAQSLLDTAAQPIWGPIKLSWDGLKKLAIAGVVPMIVFCLIFILCSITELATVYLGRAIMGPQDYLVAATVSPYIFVAGRIGYFLVALPLLAAALDRYLRHSYAEDAAEAAVEEIVSVSD